MSAEDTYGTLWIEWDEPGAGTIRSHDGRRSISFGVGVDWSDPHNPVVDEGGLSLLCEIQERADCDKWQRVRIAELEARIAELEASE
jgi:hypothetical protein